MERNASTRSSGTKFQQTFGKRQQQRHLLAERERRALMLSEDGADAAAMFDHLAGAFIDHGPEAGKYFEFEKLSIVEPQALRRCLEDGGLRLAADARDTLSNIDRGFLIFVKKTRVEVNLSVRDRNKIGRDIGAHIAGLGFGDWQRRERPSAVLGRELGRGL